MWQTSCHKFVAISLVGPESEPMPGFPTLTVEVPNLARFWSAEAFPPEVGYHRPNSWADRTPDEPDAPVAQHRRARYPTRPKVGRLPHFLPKLGTATRAVGQIGHRTNPDAPVAQHRRARYPTQPKVGRRKQFLPRLGTATREVGQIALRTDPDAPVAQLLSQGTQPGQKLVGCRTSSPSWVPPPAQLGRSDSGRILMPPSPNIEGQGTQPGQKLVGGSTSSPSWVPPPGQLGRSDSGRILMPPSPNFYRKVPNPAKSWSAEAISPQVGYCHPNSWEPPFSRLEHRAEGGEWPYLKRWTRTLATRPMAMNATMVDEPP